MQGGQGGKTSIDLLDIKNELLSYFTFLQECYEEDYCFAFSPSVDKNFKKLFTAPEAKKQDATPSQSQLNKAGGLNQAQHLNNKPSKQAEPIETDTYTEMKAEDQTVKQQADETAMQISACKTSDELKDLLQSFNGCSLKTPHTRTVFYDGSLNAKLLLIGEAPGEDENLAGVPFCGRSGKLLMEAFKAINLHREQDFLITNCVFYRPPANRPPTDAEMQACKPFISKLIELQGIDKIILIGSSPLKNILGIDGISTARQKIFEAEIAGKKIKTTCLYHPSYLLRNPFKKREMYIDLLWLRANFFDA